MSSLFYYLLIDSVVIVSLLLYLLSYLAPGYECSAQLVCCAYRLSMDTDGNLTGQSRLLSAPEKWTGDVEAHRMTETEIEARSEEEGI